MKQELCVAVIKYDFNKALGFNIRKGKSAVVTRASSFYIMMYRMRLAFIRIVRLIFCIIISSINGNIWR